ncbi:putative ATP-dependent RNA helicase TDRD12 [Euwallacea similis]|uniref:putative ATP-dependent RNA helicase TDRD12 n=1 Tax=Euwallacea similis TaxID=1736056 RepID=UPI00344E9CC8
MDIEVLNFIAPHVFYVTTASNAKERANLLNEISLRIKKHCQGISDSGYPNEILGVSYQSGYARAQVVRKIPDNAKKDYVYYCWLIDHATLVKSFKLYRIPEDIQKIPTSCQAASLKNICYLQEKLQIGIAGNVKRIPTVIPTLGVLKYATNLISNYQKITFEVNETVNNTLIGELIIHKEGQVFHLTKELCDKNFLDINETLFESIKCTGLEYIKTHIKGIFQSGKVFKANLSNLSESQNSSSYSKKTDTFYSDLEEMDVGNFTPLENGRRRNKLSEEQYLNVNESDTEKNSSKYIPRDGELESSTTLNKNLSGWEKLREYKRKKAASQHSKNVSNSPFANITSEKDRVKRKIMLVPAGMERTTGIKNKSPNIRHSTPITHKISNGSEVVPKNSAAAKSRTDEDCLTMKVPKVCNTLTNDQLSVEKVQRLSTKEESLSELCEPIYSKHEFWTDVTGCTCRKCRNAINEDDWDAPIKFGFTHETDKNCKSKGPIIKPSRLLKPDAPDNTKEQFDILSINYKGMSTMEKKLSGKILVHGESIPNPTRDVSKLNIHPQIHNSMNQTNYKESKRIQLYAFTSITRNQNVFMVGDKKTGKTMAYLPILISFVMEKQERYSQLLKIGGGPLIIILCSNSMKCEEVYWSAKMIMSKHQKKCMLITYPEHGNTDNIDILITMPSILSTMIINRAINLKLLCHLVLEDADVILKQHNELVMKMLNLGDQILSRRNCPKSIQLILCAQHWSAEIENLALNLNKIPLICIADHLESALYGKMKFVIQFLDTSCKTQNLLKMLKDWYKFRKSVIICDQNELEEIQTFLTLNGIEFTSFMDEIQEEDILYLETVWSKSPEGMYSVLICTDDIYNILTITSAHLLIHYSLPHNWSQFKRRFSCLLENVPSPLEDKDKQKSEISSYVFIDESCKQYMSKFCNFVKISGLEKGLPEKLKAFFKVVSSNVERERVKKRIEICPTLRVIGKCEAIDCEKRHILDQKLDKSVNILPQNGIIKFKILTMTDAASCSIRLLEQFDLNGVSIRKYEDKNEEINDMLAMNIDYKLANNPKPMHIYLLYEDERYFRCKVIERGEDLLVYLIDRGIYRKATVKELYQMPENIKSIPSECYEAYLANIIPPFEDTRFCKMAHLKAQFLVDSNCPNAVMMATVVLQLGDNIWIDDVYEYRDMYDKSLPAMGLQLTKKLIEQGIAISSNVPLHNLYALCNKAEIELPEYSLSRSNIKQVAKEQSQVKPHWAFLDDNLIHEVTFTFAISPDDFYVRQNKFSQQLCQLEQDIQKAVVKPFYPTFQDSEVFNCCLVRDTVENKYVRGMILNISNGKAEILCVDYGDVINEDVASLKHISNEMISKLPFQSIQCSMYGITSIKDQWSDSATDLLYTMAFKEGLDLRPLFIKVVSKQDNNIVQKQYSYSIIMKDSLGHHALVNKLLIDYGFARGDEIPNFDLPEVKTNGDDLNDEIIEEVKRSDLNDDFNTEDEEFEDMYDNFDLEIIDMEGFLKNMNIPVKAAESSRKEEVTAGQGLRDLPPIKAAPAVDYLTPEVSWSQTDNVIKLNIKISDVVHAKMVVKHGRSFQFSTEKNDKKYRLNFFLYGKVGSTVQHTILGAQIRVTLKKSNAEMWPRLLFSQEKIRKLYYDVTTLKVDDDNGKRKRVMELNISDSSSEDGDNNDAMYVACSDLDSEYDCDQPDEE